MFARKLLHILVFSINKQNVPSYTTILSLLVPVSAACVQYVNALSHTPQPQTMPGHLGEAGEVASDSVPLGKEFVLIHPKRVHS